MKTTLPPADTGEDCPGPASIFHKTFGSVGSLSIAWFLSMTTPSRFGPRHCGQSAAYVEAARTRSEEQSASERVFMAGGVLVNPERASPQGFSCRRIVLPSPHAPRPLA